MEHRRKPPRLERIFQHDAPLYFVTMVTWQRQTLLAQEVAHAGFVAHARRQAKMGVAVGRYMLMPDHAHFFIRIGHEHKLGTSVKHLKESVTKALRVDAPGLRVWQPGLFDHLLRADESYAEKWAYVRMNPVRAGLVDDPDDWLYQGEIVRIDRV
jgi:REP element-mobilizing transposase RayT